MTVTKRISYRSLRRRLVRTTSLAGLIAASTTLLAANAWAQSDADSTETVVVTGSRVVSGYSLPTPVIVSSAADLEKNTPSSLPDALEKLPVFFGSSNQTAIQTNASVATSGNNLNMRDLGAIRTLVLMDGRRVPATNFTGTVDTNTLPQLLVQRVDTVLGGASAVYGSDAVTGVVNFIIDNKFEGIKGVLQDGIASRGDAQSYRAGVAGGFSFDDDKAHFVFSVERRFTAGLKSNQDRPWTAPVPVYTGLGTAASPYVLVNNARLSNESYGGLVISGPAALSGKQFAADGSLASFNPGTPTSTSTVGVGGDGAYDENYPVSADLTTNQFYAHGEYDITPDVTAFAQASYSWILNEVSPTSTANLTSITIFSHNAYLSPSEQAALGSSSSFVVNKLANDLATRNDMIQPIGTWTFTGGFQGNVFDNYKWDLYYTYGRSHLSSTQVGNINNNRLYAALDAVTDPHGNVVCQVSLTAYASFYPGCVPFNMFGVNNASQAAVNYVSENTRWDAVNTMDDVAASISGNVFEGWAGPITAALSAEYRDQSMTETTNASSLAPVNLTGVRIGTPPISLYRSSVVAPQYGSNTVWETAGEIEVPLLNDMPLVHSLDLNGAMRYTDYSTSGAVTTWKAGLVYAPIEDLRLRGMISRDIRAPTLYELFSGRTVATPAFSDPHTGLSQLTPTVSSGNPDLVPEVAHTTTLGAVYSPGWMPGLSFSIDWFHLYISNGISSVSASNAAIQCEQSGGTSALCAQIVRPLPFSDHSAANFPTEVISESVNAARTSTSGIDLDASYVFDLGDGKMLLHSLYSFQPHLYTQAFPGSTLLDAAGSAGLSRHRVNFDVGYDLGALSVQFTTRYTSSQSRSSNPTLFYANADLPSRIYNDLSLSYAIPAEGGDIIPFLSIQNLFDEAPRIVGGSAGLPGFGADMLDSGDDFLGTYFTVGVRFGF